MDVIYLLSFSSNCPPEKDVVIKLMSYITCEEDFGDKRMAVTKKASVFDDCVDSTLILRSFLLQLLLRFRLLSFLVILCCIIKFDYITNKIKTKTNKNRFVLIKT